MNITGGKVNYGRTVKTGDFENKRTDVELSFTADDGATEATVKKFLDTVSHLAIAKVHELLALAVPQHTASAPHAGTDKAALAAAATNGGTGTAVTTAEPPKTRARKPPAAAKDPADITDEDPTAKAPEPAAPKAPDPADVLDDASLFEGAAAEITDVELTSAITRKNAEIMAPQVIRALIGKYGVNANSIAQEKRAAFLKELAALTKAA